MPNPRRGAPEELEEMITRKTRSVFGTVKLFAVGMMLLFFSYLVFSPMYTVSQTEIGVVTRFGKVISVSTPGLHWKVPLFDSVHYLDTREQVNSEDMEVAIDRMPIKAKMSVNWRIDPAKAADFYGQYKSLDYFEKTILDRMIRDATKAVFPQYTVDGLFRNRSEAGLKIDSSLDEKLKGYPVVVLRAQIEDVSPPEDYLLQVREKEKAREQVERERFDLERAKLVSEREVQPADAEARAVLLRKKAEADGIKLVGDAKAEAATKLAEAIKADPIIVQYKMMEQWNGVGPTYATSANPQAWFQLPGMSVTK